MHDPVVVGVRERLADVDRDPDRLLHRQRTAPRQVVLQRDAVDVLEDDELVAVLLAAVDDGDDVRVRQLRDRLRLAAKARDGLAVLSVRRVQDLQRDVPVEQLVVGAIDARHPAGADQLLERVAPRDDVPHSHAYEIPGGRSD